MQPLVRVVLVQGLPQHHLNVHHLGLVQECNSLVHRMLVGLAQPQWQERFEHILWRLFVFDVDFVKGIDLATKVHSLREEALLQHAFESTQAHYESSLRVLDDADFVNQLLPNL